MSIFVAVADSQLRDAEQTARLVTESGLKGKAYRMDALKKKEVDKLFHWLLKEFGRLDILINSAEISLLTPFEKISEKEWDRTLNTNLRGIFLCSQAAFRVMKSQRRGKIIHVASIASRSGGMISPLYIPYAHYAASKAGIDALGKAWFLKELPMEFR